MVDLIETYRGGGFEPVGAELPDHLPMFLEFLSTRPLPEARELAKSRDPVVGFPYISSVVKGDAIPSLSAAAR